MLLIKRSNDPGKGLLSGIGGHIEKDEKPEDCMRREWEEEVGFPIPDDAGLFQILTEELPDCINHIYGIILPHIDIYFSRQMDEGFIRWHHIIGENIMYSKEVAWDGLIPYCYRLMKHK